MKSQLNALWQRFNPNRVPNLSPVAWGITLLALAGLLIAEFFVHHHSYFGFEDHYGFYAWYGFAASAGLVIAGKLLSTVLKRPEDYYKDDLTQLEAKHDD